MKFNLIGGFVWSFGIIMLGYVLGNLIPNADKYLMPIILVIILVSFIPPIYEFLKERKKVI